MSDSENSVEESVQHSCEQKSGESLPLSPLLTCPAGCPQAWACFPQARRIRARSAAAASHRRRVSAPGPSAGGAAGWGQTQRHRAPRWALAL